jgi:hypothetical protein
MTTMSRLKSSIALGLLAGVLFTGLASAQTPEAPRTATVLRYALILEEPRQDSPTLGAVEVGTALVILGKVDDYYFVRAPAGDPAAAWENGWILVVAFEPVGKVNAETSQTPRSGKLMIRGFGYAGGLFFTASDSFETILGGGFNSVFGFGGQVVLKNGIYAQASVDRFRDTGTRALVSGSQVFTLDVPNRITVMPILATVGYQGTKTGGVVPYFGGGIGWYTLEEDSPSVPGSETISSRHTGYHIVGGAEFPVSGWMSLAGELQWATVPGAIGDTGVSAVYEEKDLGGTTFRFKVLFGR